LKQSSAGNKRIDHAAPVNLSSSNGVLFESILRTVDRSNGFHTAKTHSGHVLLGKVAMNAGCQRSLAKDRINERRAFPASLGTRGNRTYRRLDEAGIKFGT
jgi:hypothetical protein